MQTVISPAQASRRPAGPVPGDRDEGVLSRLWDEAEQDLVAGDAPRATPPPPARPRGDTGSVRFAHD